ncbi:MAG: pitrilysin family protein [Planctomycetota bacterium]|nr:pitrilysin family protein [Planctomycetota bacterium]
MRASPYVCLALALAAPASAQDVSIPHQKFVLENGLEVVIHEDHSDPVVAVYVYYHVGSGRELPGRSGFAHLFEHLMFQGSENVGDDQHFKLVQEAGGTLNGTTNTDRTNYFETMPANQLELALWLEADRMGFLLPAITQEKLDNQREVVKNERRQNTENRPYGLVRETVARNLYPADHPYSWTTIGSMEDLNRATLEDVKNFFQRWYGPNNATLAIGGDVDTAAALALVKKYFGPIPRGPEVEQPKPRSAQLEHTKRVILEDRVKLPQLTYTWPTVEADHADEAALNLLASVLAGRKSAVLDRALTMEEQLASSVRCFHRSSEMAGTISITLRPQPGVSLDVLETRLGELLAGLAAEGVGNEVLERLKTVREVGVIRRLETVSGRTSRMADSNTYRGQADTVAWDLERHAAVTSADVVRVLREHVLDRPAVVVSVVPEGELQLVASGRNAEQSAREASFDRSLQPGPAPRKELRMPAVWHGTFANGVSVVGTRYDELPLTSFSLAVPAGRLMEDMSTLGLASMTADMLDEGTQRLTGTELRDELDALGATLFIRSGDDEITFGMNVLNKHLAAAVALLEEVLIEPRFAPDDFARRKQDRLTDLEVRPDNIRSIASDAWDALMYGTSSVAGMPDIGTPETIERMTVENVAAFWQRHGKPVGARLTFVGALDGAGVAALFDSLTARWKAPGAEAVPAAYAEVTMRFPAETRIYLVDKPGAAQSEIRIGHPGVSELDPDSYPLEILNYILGGSFSSRINLNLREDKGYTYGARSRFSGGLRPGPFTASSGVRTDVTAESVTELMKEIEGILDGVTEEELAFTRSALVQAMDRRFESTRSLQRHIGQISRYGYPDDYLSERLAILESLGQEGMKTLANEHLHPERMAILVVGDKERILEKLQALPYGEVIELDTEGRPLPGN